MVLNQLQLKHTEHVILEYIQSHDTSTKNANFQAFFERVSTSLEQQSRSNSYIDNADQAIEIRKYYRSLQELHEGMHDAEIVRIISSRYEIKERKICKILGLPGYPCSNALTF